MISSPIAPASADNQAAQTAGQPRTGRIALVNMPFAMADRPSIQCGLLKAVLRRAGHYVDVHYFNLELAKEIGAEVYSRISYLRANMLLGEWLFSVAAFGARTEDEDWAARPGIDESFREMEMDFSHLRHLRDVRLPEWINECADSAHWADCDVIGFTSTFEQNNASFALARALKARHPKVKIVFGGANFDGDMGQEYVRALSFIDYAVIGEGEHALPLLVERIIRNESPLDVDGVVGRANGQVAGGRRGSLERDMDGVPDPDYDEFFAAMFRLGTPAVLARKANPVLLIETSRGCWWGQKHHCTFCGLNSNGMTFRAKTPANALAQMRRMSARYRITNFEAVDNILDYRYLEEVCKPLADGHMDFRFFYEVKANLKREQLRTMSRAGIRAIQPGIESLNSHVLTLMRKGISMLHNVRCIKWAHYYGMRVGWNVLTGFPGETAEDYRQQVELIPLLRHLPPPGSCGRIWLERFSPYFMDDTFPVTNVRPLDSYRFVYPEALLDIPKVAYFFDYDMADTMSNSQLNDLRTSVADWKKAWEPAVKPQLVYQRAPDWIQVFDRRNGNVTGHTFDGVAAEAFELCSETDRTVSQVCADIAERSAGGADPAEVQQALDDFCRLGLAIEEEGRYLTLALPVNPNW